MTDDSGAPPSPGGTDDYETSDALPELAALIALDAVDDDERAAIAGIVAGAAPDVRERYEAALRDHRQALADYSATSAAAPPGRVLGRVLARIDDPGTTAGEPPAAESSTAESAVPASLDEVRERRRQRRKRITAAVIGTAAAVVIAVGGIVISDHTGGGPQPPSAQSVLAEPDVHTVSTAIGGGTASVAFSRDADAAVLVMHDVPPPSSGSVYQLWLMGPDHPPKSVGMMGPKDVAPKTQALVDGIAGSSRLGVSVEPAGGSPQPTDVVATVSLG